MKKFHIKILFLLLWNFSFSQQFTNYTSKDGLPSNHVYRITQDNQGFIWFITDKGIVKYNGTAFKPFTIRNGLPTNDIWNIVVTPNGKVWYFSKSPKIGYIDNDSVYAFPSAIKNEILSPLNRNFVGNEITFNNSSAHYQLENRQWKSYDNSGSNSVLKQYKTYLNHHKLHRIQFSKDLKHLLFIDKKNNEVKRIKVFQEFFDSHTRAQVNDSTYILLSDKAYSILNLNTYKFKTTLFEEVTTIKKSKYVRIHLVNNQIQITGKGFVATLDKDYNLVNTHYIPSHLKAHFSFVDKQDNLWIATFTNGVYKLPKSKQNAIYDLTNEKIGKIKKIDNHLITTVLDKGFYHYDSVTKQFKPYIKETNFAYGVFQIKALNKTYFITDNKITTINKQKRTILYALKINNYFNETARQLVYHKNYLYGNFTSGLNQLNPKDLSLNKVYLSNGIRTFISFKEELIIATSNGLKILKNDSIKALEYQTEIPNNLHKKPILSLNKLDDTSLLVGTDSYGAFITDLNRIIPLKETEFLSINSSFVENNNLWMATDKGVWHYKKDTSNTYIYTANYDENDGLLLKNAKAVYATDENLLISSNVGIVNIPKKKNNTKQLLAIYIANSNFNGEKIISNTVKYTNDNTVYFSISDIDFSENSDFSYEYQLLPIQKKWITTTSKQISYTDLPPNKYVLNIRSKGEKNSVHFKISPLWHQTLLAKILFSLFFLTIMTSSILIIRKGELKKQAKKLNTKRKLAEFELYALRSQMNPHFVFNSLNAIQYYLNDNKIELSEKYLVKFSKLIRMFFDFSEHKVISIKEEVQLLDAYLEIEKLRFGTEFNYLIDADNNLNLEQEIPAMLLQPIVENGVNHGLFHNFGKGLIKILFQKINNRIYEVIIEDNGVGRDKAKEIKEHSLNKHQSKSTQILQERITLLNQSNQWNITYKITDLDKEKNNGTRVYLKFERL